MLKVREISGVFFDITNDVEMDDFGKKIYQITVSKFGGDFYVNKSVNFGLFFRQFLSYFWRFILYLLISMSI
jgi:hypothetical protein